MSRRGRNPDYLNGVPELIILSLLDREPMYGYQIVESIERESGQTLSFGEGCIYPILHRLEKEKLIRGEKALVKGRNRITYSLTKMGQGRLQQSASNWERIASAISTIIKEDDHEPISIPA